MPSGNILQVGLASRAVYLARSQDLSVYSTRVTVFYHEDKPLTAFRIFSASSCSEHAMESLREAFDLLFYQGPLKYVLSPDFVKEDDEIKNHDPELIDHSRALLRNKILKASTEAVEDDTESESAYRADVIATLIEDVLTDAQIDQLYAGINSTISDLISDHEGGLAEIQEQRGW